MKKIILSACFIYGIASLEAQTNLVPNPSFELYDTCPFITGQITFATPWNTPVSISTPDYMNVCDTVSMNHLSIPSNYAGYELAHSGNAYATIVTYTHSLINPSADNAREYIQVQLLDTLVTNVTYCIRFFVSAGDSCQYVCNDIGVFFSPTPLHDNTCWFCPLPVSPQFENAATNSLSSRNGWTLIAGNYTALGGEKYIVIGNFKDSTTSVATFTGWTTSTIACFASYYIDDVLLAPCDSLNGIQENIKVSNINVYPNPVKTNLTVTLLKGEGVLTVYNIVGEKVFSNKIINTQTEIDVGNLPKGMYFVEVETEKDVSRKKIVKE